MQWNRGAAMVLLMLSLGALRSGAVRPTPAGRCAAAKLHAANVKLSSTLRCHETALRKSRPVDGVCLSRAEAHFNVAFAKAEAKGGCVVTGDAAAVEARVDAAVATLVGAAPVTTSTTSVVTTTTGVVTTTTTSTTSTTTLVVCANAGAPVCNGSCSPGGTCWFDPIVGCFCLFL